MDRAGAEVKRIAPEMLTATSRRSAKKAASAWEISVAKRRLLHHLLLRLECASFRKCLTTLARATVKH
jgi:hypothetical protein